MKQIVYIMAILVSLGSASSAWASKKIYVGNLPFSATSVEVNRLVVEYGDVLSVRVRSIDDNGTTSANAVITFSSEEEADTAVEGLDGILFLGGEPISVKKKPREIVVVGSKVKEVVRAAGLRSDGELVQAVSEKVHEVLETAIHRASSNKRGTVRPYDL